MLSFAGMSVLQFLQKYLIINVLRLILVILFFIAFLNITYTGRHTFASTVTLANNISLEVVSKMLGHTNTRMTAHYAKLIDKCIGEQMDNLWIRSQEILITKAYPIHKFLTCSKCR